MKIIFLGTGTSTGVPEIGCQCEVCTSKDKRDWRLRTSAVVETEGRRILIDCGPDFRWQVITNRIYQLDAVLITHEHYDHVGGLDDLRPFCRYGEVNVYAEENVAYAIKTRIPYVFAEHKYPGVPNINMHAITTEPFEAAGLEIVPIRLMHGKLPIMGYRIGNVAWITDMLTMPDESYDVLKGLDYLFMNALRIEPHWTHQSLLEALEQVVRIGAKETYFIHMSHQMGLHAEVDKQLPEHVHLAYDGLMVINE